MPLIFPGHPGRVVAIEDTTVQGAVNLLDMNPSANFNQHRVIFNQVQIAETVNAQFAHMFGSDIYVYVFGDEIAPMVISGLAVVDCETGRHGFSAIHDYYRQNRLANRLSPIDVLVGQTDLQAMLINFRSTVIDVEKRLMGFQLGLNGLPELDQEPVDFGVDS